jgi:hypothetical protein
MEGRKVEFRAAVSRHVLVLYPERPAMQPWAAACSQKERF